MEGGARAVRRTRRGLTPLQTLKRACGAMWKDTAPLLAPLIAALVKAGDASWEVVPRRCRYLGDALLAVWRRSPEDAFHLFQHMPPGAQARTREALRALHRPLWAAPAELRLRILQESLDDAFRGE